MPNIQLLDEIVTDEKTLTGVIDFVSTKYVTFFDFGMNDDPDLVKILMIWRFYYSHIRFSIFKELYFKGINLDQPILINKKTIRSPAVFEVTKPKRKSQRLPNNARVVDFVQSCDDHQGV